MRAVGSRHGSQLLPDCRNEAKSRRASGSGVYLDHTALDTPSADKVCLINV